jgi:hypothetical protein
MPAPRPARIPTECAALTRPAALPMRDAAARLRSGSVKASGLTPARSMAAKVETASAGWPASRRRLMATFHWASARVLDGDEVLGCGRKVRDDSEFTRASVRRNAER